MRVGALGPVEVLSAAGVYLGGPKPKALLAALMLEAGRVVALDRLIDLIWDERPPRSAVALVHTYVSALRRGFASIGEHSVLVTRAPGYVLEVEPADLDLMMFDRHLQDARRLEREEDSSAAADSYRHAIALWRGAAFGGVDAQFARTRAVALEDERLAAEEGLARCELSLGQVAAALSRVTALSAAHPLREEARGLLMRALYVSGRQGDALAAYREGRERLIDELGIEPGQALRELHTQILGGTLAMPTTAGAVVTLRRADPTASVPNQLPPDVTDFTGRSAQVDRLIWLARSDVRTPIVVVSGVAGAGKSALAVHCAHLLADDYPDGQLFADLHGADKTSDGADVLGRFLRALGVTSAELPDSLDERAELYRMTVANRRLIIVLDNVRGEHQVRKLLPGSGDCLVIITSRSRLTGIAGVEPVELDKFSVAASVEMLGRIIGPDRVAAEAEEAAMIGRLCGGIPLAIRVAGAKLLARTHWPLRTLAARLSDERRRLDELSLGDLAIRSSLGLGYDELDSLRRKAFHLLTLLDLPDFGSWVAAPLLEVSVDDAEEVVEHLVDLRLLDVAGVDALGRVRYRFHDLVRLFGAEQAAGAEPAELVSDALGRTLAAWMALVEAGASRLPRVTLGLRPALPCVFEVDPRLVNEVLADPTGWLTSETPAVVRAIERAHELGIDEPSTTLITSLLSSPFAARNEFDGWRRTHDVALKAAVSSGNKRAEATVRAGLGQLFYERDDFPTALEHFRLAFTDSGTIGDESIQAVALVGIGTVQRDLAQFDQARRSLTDAAELAARTGDRSVLAAARYGLSAILRDRGDLDAAERDLERCLDLYHELGDPRGEGFALRGLSLCKRAAGEMVAAADLSRQAHLILDRIGDTLGAAYALQSLAKAQIRLGTLAGVSDLLVSCLDVCINLRDRFGTALITRTQGELALAEGRLDLAADLLRSALDQWRELGLPLWEARTLRDLAAATGSTEHWSEAARLFAAMDAREHAELAGLSPQKWLDRVRLEHL